MIDERISYAPTSVGSNGFGGLGGGGFIEGIILAALLGRGGKGGLLGGDNGCGGDASLSADGIAAKTALLVNQNADQNALLGAIANANATTIAEGRATLAAICDAEKTNLQQFYAASIQTANSTQSIKDQATAFAIVNDKRFDDLASAGVLQTASILARINDVETQGLRDQLAASHRHAAHKDVEISINNSANAVQAQFQNQNQWQLQRDAEINRKFDAVFNSFNQVNRTAQDIINLGTMTASGTQATTATNIK